jgi:hypothetical protein
MMDNNFLERLDCLGTSLERAHDGANVGLNAILPILSTLGAVTDVMVATVA